MVVVMPRLPESERRQPREIARLIAGRERPPAEAMAQRVDAERRAMQDEHPYRGAPQKSGQPSGERAGQCTPRPNGMASPSSTQNGNKRLMRTRSRATRRA